MTLSEQQIIRIQELATIFLTVSDIALDIGVDAGELRQEIANEDSQASKAYRKGKLHTIITIHEQEVELAKVGSPTSVENLRKSLLDMEDDEI